MKDADLAAEVAAIEQERAAEARRQVRSAVQRCYTAPNCLLGALGGSWRVPGRFAFRAAAVIGTPLPGGTGLANDQAPLTDE